METASLRRIAPLLRWQLRFDHRRVLLWLVAGGYLLLAGPATLWVASLFLRAPFPLPTSRIFLGGLIWLHWFLALGLAMSRSARTVDDRTSGILALTKISNISPGAWVAFRFLSVVVGYLPIWAVRLPLYVLAYHFGGVTLSRFLVPEFFQWIAFLSTAAIGLLIARFYDTPQTARFAIIGVVVLGEMILLVPLKVLQGVRLFVGAAGIPGHDLLEWLFSRLSGLSLMTYSWTTPETMDEWLMALAAVGLHVLIAAAALWALRRTVFFNVGVDDSVGSAAAEKDRRKPATVRTSRRVWDDALAWLCFNIHSNGRKTIRTKCVSYGMMGLLLLAIPLTNPGLMATFLIVSPLIVAAIASFKTGDCLVRELRGQTLSTLALLPFSEMELYRGWKRGALRLAVPDLVYVGVAMGVLCFLIGDSQLPLGVRVVVVALCGAILLATPFFFLNNLLSFERAFVPIGCLSVFIVIGAPILSGIVAANATPEVGLGLFAFFVIVAHIVFTALIPGCFRKRIEKVS